MSDRHLPNSRIGELIRFITDWESIEELGSIEPGKRISYYRYGISRAVKSVRGVAAIFFCTALCLLMAWLIGLLFSADNLVIYALVFHPIILGIAILVCSLIWKLIMYESIIAGIRVAIGLDCANCGYCMMGNVSGRCPECGMPHIHRQSDSGG
jgi:hypothetical protein